MNLPPLSLIILGISWAITMALWFSLWKSKEPLWFKIVASVAAVIPVFGPFLYFFLKMPAKLPMRLRATMNHYGIGGRFIGFGSDQFNFDSVSDQKEVPTSESFDKTPQPKARRALTRWEKIGLVVGFIFLAMYWIKALHYFSSGDAWGHRNYWGQFVGTFLLIAILVAGSIAFIAIVWRFWLAKYFEIVAAEPDESVSLTSRSTRTRRKRRSG